MFMHHILGTLKKIRLGPQDDAAATLYRTLIKPHTISLPLFILENLKSKYGLSIQSAPPSSNLFIVYPIR